MIKKILTCLSLIIGFSFSLTSQITVDNSYTLDEYVNDILLGSGVTAFNVEYTGSLDQLGFMEGADGTLFPINEGLVLSTSTATNLSAEDCIEDNPPFEDMVSGNSDLLDIANSVPGMINQNFAVNSVNDLCILEFDFIATGDTVKFNYAFGSDEYESEFGTDYVNTQYNDIFAFFLSGPGIAGPYENNAINIAQVPGIEPPLPITISSVNQFLNTEYFIGNSTNVDICQNGFTVSIEASHTVTCGETYHIRLAIGDGSDTALESVVVLEAGSFTSNSVVEVDLSIDVGLPDENLIYEDCGLATLTFTRPIETILDVEEMVIINYAGTATNGVDYSQLPDTIIFAPGVQTVQFEVDAFIDDIAEGEENVQMEILNLAACNGGGLTSYFEFIINDLPPTLVVDGYTVNVCLGDTIEIEPTITGGYGNYSFEWDTGEDTPSIEVGPDVTSSYNVIVSDTCGMEPDDADIEVVILEFPSIDVTINGGDLLLDCNEFVEVTGQAEGGDGNFTYEWQDQNGNNLFGFENSLFYGTWQGASEIHLVVTDGCGFTEETFINVNLTIPPIVIDLPDLVAVDCNEPFDLTPVISGGEMPYVNMAWYDGTGGLIQFDQNLNYATGLTQTIQFQVTDFCGQTESYDVDIEINAPPVEVTLPDSFTGTCLDSFDLTAEIIGGLPEYEFEWMLDGVLMGDGPGVTLSLAESNEITVTVSDACSTSGSATSMINIINPPVEVDLGDDIFTVCITQSDISPVLVNGLGELSYSWNDGDVPFSDEGSIVYQTYENTVVTLEVTDECGTVGSDELAYNLLPTPIELTLSEDPVICAGDETTLFASAIGGEGDLSIFWTSLNSYDEEETVSPDFSQSYQVQVTDVCGNETTGNIFVEVQESFALFEYDFITETEVQFFASEESQCETCDLFWNFGDGESSLETNPLHVFDGLFEYTTWFVVTNELGCTDSISTVVPAPIIIYVPNAFTPNNDGINDFFAVKGAQIEQYQIQIFNRWGEVVFESNDIEEIWDGSTNGGEYYSKNEVYNYLIKVKGYDSKAYEKKGFITLMR